MNVANRQFLYFNKDENTSELRTVWTTPKINDGELIDDHLIGDDEYYHPDNYLWYFVADGDNYKIATKGPKTSGNIYLDKWNYNANTHYYIQDFSSTGVAWGIEPYPYSKLGVCIQSKIGGTTGPDKDGYWYTASDGGYTYVQRHDLSDSNPDYYTFVLYSYDDLLAEAAAQGINTSTYAAADKTSGASFQTLVNAIVDAKAQHNVPAKADGKYLLRNRRYGLFLSANGTVLQGTSTATDYTVWNFTTNGGTSSLVSKAGEGSAVRVTTSGNDAVWNLSATDPYNATIQSSSDGDARYVSFMQKSGVTNGHLGMHADGSPYARPSSGYTSDWEMIPVVTDPATGEMTYTLDGTTHTIAKAIASEDELIPEDEDPLKAKYFRIMNATRSVASYNEDRFGGGGWLEDVDKMHFTYRKEDGGTTEGGNPEAFEWEEIEAMLMYSAKDVPFYAAEPNMSHASALWEFILVGRGSGNEENATGLISPEHNIYILRNANTGKYIKNTSDLQNTSYLKTTDNQNDALKFYLTRLVDGQWGINVYGGTTSGTDSANGYLYIGGESDGYHAGLAWSDTATPAKDSRSAWIITEAPTLELQLLVRDLVQDGASDDSYLYDWTTFYYPFDVTLNTTQNPSGQTVNMFAGEWAGTFTYSDGQIGGSIKMNEITGGIPAGNAVFIRSTKNGNESYTKVILDVWPAGNVTAQASAFSTNVWKGIVESGDNVNGENYFGDNWRDYWVLSRNSKKYLRLLHPASNYLLPNRAYLDALTAQNAASGARVNTFNLVFDGATYIQGVKSADGSAPSAVYNLQGQRVNGAMARGLMIVNGKKVVIK